MTHPDIDRSRPGQLPDSHDFQSWSLRPVVDDPAAGARMRKAIRLRARQALVEAAMSVREREAHNLAKIEERENGFGAVFGWTPGVAFSFSRLSPADYEIAYDGGCGTGNDHNAGLDHLTWYRENGRPEDGRPVAIVSQPYRPAFEDAKREEPGRRGGAGARNPRRRTRRGVGLVQSRSDGSSDLACRLDAPFGSIRSPGIG